MYSRRLSSAEETAGFAGRLARLADADDLILLTGGIGSGKTTFAKGFAAGLGVEETVTSPTFVVHAVYDSGRLPLNHVDLYRLGASAEVDELGIWDYVDGAVTLVEWADRYGGFGAPCLRLDFALGRDDDERVLTVTPEGGSWQRRLEQLAIGQPAA